MTSRPRLRILFATTHPHLPQMAGGLQASTDETIRRLRARGHDARHHRLQPAERARRHLDFFARRHWCSSGSV